MRRLLFASALAATIGSASVARAFCRTTGEPPTSFYDPAATGVCWTTPDGGPGLDLAWHQSLIGYSLDANASKQVNLSDATRIADLAFNAWNNATCPYGCTGGACKHPNVQAYDLGTVSPDAAADDCGLIACDASFHDPQHVIVFRDNAWNHTDANNTLALTTVTFGERTGTIYDADIEINSFMWTLSTSDPSPPGTYSLQYLLTHEAGHFFGLAHSNTQNAIMYVTYRGEATMLQPDDIQGICSIYPPPASHSSSCSSTGAPPVGGAPSMLGWTALGLLALRRRNL